MVKHFIYAVLKSGIFCLLMLLDYVFIYMDAQYSTDDLKENSFTEWAAEIQLAIMIAFLIYIAKRNKSNQSFISLLAGSLLMVLIREFNNFFSDYVFNGACTSLMIVAAAVSAYFFYKQRSAFLSGAYQFMRSPGYGWFLAGAFTVFIFSRLLGLPDLWHLILRGNYLRKAERFAEEALELLGYSFMLIGICEYKWFLNRNTNT